MRNRQIHRGSLLVFLLLLTPFSQVCCEEPVKIKPSPDLLFHDAFCCGNLDKWKRWNGEFPLDIYNRPGTVTWKNKLDFEASAGIASGPLRCENYEFRVDLLRWPVNRAGVCVVVRASTGEETYSGYRLRIEGEKAWLEKHTGEGSWRSSTHQQGPVTVKADQFNKVWIQVYGQSPVKVRAKIWAQVDYEPKTFQFEIVDEDPTAFAEGPLGTALWYQVAGEWLEPYESADSVSVTVLKEGW